MDSYCPWLLMPNENKLCIEVDENMLTKIECLDSQEITNILWSLDRWVHFMSPNPFDPLWYYPLIQCLVLWVVSPNQAFHPKFCTYFLSPHVNYMPCPSHSPWFLHQNNTWWSQTILRVCRVNIDRRMLGKMCTQLTVIFLHNYYSQFHHRPCE